MTKIKSYALEASRFSRQWWFGGAKNLLFVAVISVLIWAYADMAVTENEEFRATIVLTTGNSQELILLPPHRVDIKTFKLRGARSSLRDFQRELDKNRSEILYDVSREYGPGKHSIPVADILAQSDRARKMGLIVVSAAPSTISIEIDRLLHVPNLPVEVQFDGGRPAEDNPPEIRPAMMGIRVAESVWLRIVKVLPKVESRKLRTSPVDLKNAPTGEPITREAAIIPEIAGLRVRPDQATVKVTLQVSQRTDEKPFRIAVQVRFPHTWTEDDTWREYELIKTDRMEWLPQITVSGAKKDLERLKPEDIEAYITLTDDDKTPVASRLQREVTVRFPPGMDLELIGATPAVHFKLQKRTPTPTTE